MRPHDPAQITATSRSNLALAFVSLPRDRKRDIELFYAFCRLVDDIADDPAMPVQEKASQLAAWEAGITGPDDSQPLASAVRDLIERRGIEREHFLEIIAGVRMDLEPVRYETFQELAVYCHRVASVVGLVSIEIFGYKNPRCKRYAVALGMALQLTNILRDVAVDLENGGRIYLPLEDMQRFGLQPEGLRDAADKYAFRALMEYEAGRAEAFYADAVRLLPGEDRRSMVAAEIMRRVYHRLLRKMKHDGFRVFKNRYRVSKATKAMIVARTMSIG